MTDCMYCELDIHGGCLLGDCPCKCEGDRNFFLGEDLLADVDTRPRPEGF